MLRYLRYAQFAEKEGNQYKVYLWERYGGTENCDYFVYLFNHVSIFERVPYKGNNLLLAMEAFHSEVSGFKELGFTIEKELLVEKMEERN